MNYYKKYCPNVYVASCEEKHYTGEVIELTTVRGKVNKHVVHNYLGETVDGRHLYSIIRLDGLNAQTYAQNKAEKLQGYSANAKAKSEEWYEKSNEGRDFLKLAEPIKIGHHSEKRHRALIERNWNRMSKSMEFLKKSQSYNDRIEYWERKSKEINLSMPESLEFFKIQLDEAKEYHKGLKDGTIEREHSYSLTYAKKKINDLTKKLKIAEKLWG